jgi:hypothetical protein
MAFRTILHHPPKTPYIPHSAQYENNNFPDFQGAEPVPLNSLLIYQRTATILATISWR